MATQHRIEAPNPDCPAFIANQSNAFISLKTLKKGLMQVFKQNNYTVTSKGTNTKPNEK